MKRLPIRPLLFSFLLLPLAALAQKPNVLDRIGNRVQGMGNMGGGATGGDSLKHRNRYEDTVSVRFYYLDSTFFQGIDTTVTDFTRRYPMPATSINLGNTGTATRSLLFGAAGHAGFDPGFHAFDAYKVHLDQVPFYRTTRPYTELGYVLGARAEQMIDILHTQNIRPNWNFSFRYRQINAPGVFRNHKTNHNNYVFNNWFQSKNRRYNNYLVLLGNRLQSGESGGMLPDRDYLNDKDYAKDRFLIPTRIGGDPTYATNFFSTNLNTGNRYREFNVLLRQQYDFGKKDSLVSDSVVTPLFYPRLRFEHTLVYGNYQYEFIDYYVFNPGRERNAPDSAYYWDNYRLSLPGTTGNDSLFFRDRWKELRNDFSIYSYPDIRNGNQFIRLGAEVQQLKGAFENYRRSGNRSFVNIMGHGEYRNRTRNGKWDLLAQGRLWFAGYNLGDYHAFVSLQRSLGARLGYLMIGGENINRTAPFLYDQRSAFYLDAPKSFNKENTLHFFGSLNIDRLRLQLRGDYYLLTNYLYLKNYRELSQESTLFNVLRVSALKSFKVGRRWNLHSEVYLQQKTGSAEVNFPALFTRNRFQYEGDFGFRNLRAVFGLEARYHTPYKADNYSPVLGQFFYQDSVRISNLPDVHAFLHFRIRSFKAFIRAENLNTARLFGGFQFNNNNLSAPGYATPGLVLRFGIFWGFVN